MKNYEELQTRKEHLQKFIDHLDFFKFDKTITNFKNLCSDVLFYANNPYSTAKFLDLIPHEIKLYKNLLKYSWTSEENKKTLEKKSDQLLNFVFFLQENIRENTL